MARTVVATEIATPARRQRATVLDLLREAKHVDEAAIARAELVAARTGQPVEQVLNQLGSLTDDDLAMVYAQVAKCPIWDPEKIKVAADLTRIGVSAEYLRRAKLLPLVTPGPNLTFAAGDPLDDEALSGLVFATGKTISILVARPGDLKRGLDNTFGIVEPLPVVTDSRRLEREVDLVSDNAVEGGGARLVLAAFEAAIAVGASDIHFEPRRHDLRIRLRVDGRLLDHQVVSGDLAAPAVSRIKVIANLNLGERRLPQDGRTTFVIHGKQVDVRVATSPTAFGESAVLRILDRSTVPLDLGAMGLSDHLTACLRQAARSPHGIFLVTGPTGSGKTTTLYAALKEINTPERKILTVEDPVEYMLDGINQVPIKPQIGLTFASALRAFLRQDPDVMMVGEIRDRETAEIAIQAALTGHLLLSTLHTNSAAAAVTRLLDMGIDDYLLTSTLHLIVGQRLVRRLCEHCKEHYTPDAETLLKLGVPERSTPTWRRAVGCPQCQGSGYRGRTTIVEALPMTDSVRAKVLERADAHIIEQIAISEGMRTLFHHGIDRIDAGLTTVEEVLRVTNTA